MDFSRLMSLSALWTRSTIWMSARQLKIILCFIEHQRIVILEKDLQSYRDKVSQIERSISSAMETPLITPMPLPAQARKMNIKDINDSSLGPISKKRELRKVCDLDIEEIGHVFDSPYGNLESILGYGLFHGEEQYQRAIKAAISRAVKIVAEKKGIWPAVDLAFSPDVRQKQESSSRVPDWVQLYVKLETKLPDSGWQTMLNFLNLGRSEKVLFTSACLIDSICLLELFSVNASAAQTFEDIIFQI